MNTLQHHIEQKSTLCIALNHPMSSNTTSRIQAPRNMVFSLSIYQTYLD